MNGFLPAFLGMFAFAFLVACLVCFRHSLPRVIRGRHRPDYKRIAELELALGMREPEPGESGHRVQRGKGPNQPKWIVTPTRMTYANVETQLGRDIAIGLALGMATTNEARRKRAIPPPPSPRRGSPAWQAAYERGRHEALIRLAHLDHDHEQIDVTAIGDRERRYVNGRCIEPPQ